MISSFISNSIENSNVEIEEISLRFENNETLDILSNDDNNKYPIHSS